MYLDKLYNEDFLLLMMTGLEDRHQVQMHYYLPEHYSDILITIYNTI